MLLGNGRDLITIDATVQFRIRDARAWQYASQNPVDGLRAIAYRAVMRTTVNHTLTEALSENVVALTARMREMVQEDADAMGIGVQVLDFTIGGMHPPVAVAADYQAVVSAELGKVTAVVDAQATRNRTRGGPRIQRDQETVDHTEHATLAARVCRAWRCPLSCFNAMAVVVREGDAVPITRFGRPLRIAAQADCTGSCLADRSGVAFLTCAAA